MPKVISVNPNVAPESVRSQTGAALHALKDSMVRGKMLTGKVSSVESREGVSFVTVLYEGVPVIIPLSKMGFTERAMSDEHQASVTANSMAGAEIDFIVEHVDAERGAATASRAAAMKQKSQDFFVGDKTHKPIVTVGSLVEARVIGVMEYSVRLEIFGVEKYLKSRELARKWIADCRLKYDIGDTIVMRVTKIDVQDGKLIDIAVEGASVQENFKTTCLVGNRYVGEVTGYSKGIFFISLDEGSNAIAHASAAAGYLPKKRDSVAFVATRIMDDGKTVAGKIVRVISRYRGNY